MHEVAEYPTQQSRHLGESAKSVWPPFWASAVGNRPFRNGRHFRGGKPLRQGSGFTGKAPVSAWICPKVGYSFWFEGTIHASKDGGFSQQCATEKKASLVWGREGFGNLNGDICICIYIYIYNITYRGHIYIQKCTCIYLHVYRDPMTRARRFD